MNNNIGQLKESALHNALKTLYAGYGKTEAPVNGYVCDGISPSGEILEVQTGSFAPLRRKAAALKKGQVMRVIHPVIVSKKIETYAEGGALLRRRTSPRKGTPYDVFKALVHAPELAQKRGVVIELALVEVNERRIDDGKGSWRRRGISLAGRELTGQRGTLRLACRSDWMRLLPFKRGERFTCAALAEKAGIRVSIARKMICVMKAVSFISDTGEREKKRGSPRIYTI